MAASAELGVPREVQVPRGRIRYRERGEGPPVVFVHGVLANADLWRAVVPAVADAGFRCIAPDLPLGSHQVPVPDADLSPPGVAALVEAFLERLDLDDVTIVANDTGGAITQLLMAGHPDRIGRVVLTPSDSFERFFPPAFAPLSWLARIPGSMWPLAQLTRIRPLRDLGFGLVARRPVPAEVVESYLGPIRRDRGVRGDLRRVLRGVHRRHTLAAAAALPSFTKPVLLAWAADDRLFPIDLAHRLVAVLPQARLVTVRDSRTFVPEDQPSELARLVVEFAGARTAP